MNWRDRLRQAFAVESPEAIQIDDETKDLIHQLCLGLIRRQLAVPTLLFLEMSRPLNFIGAQGLHALTPILSTVVSPGKMKRVAEFFEQRGSVEYICRQLEELQKPSGRP